jgi:hypothetical protein
MREATREPSCETNLANEHEMLHVVRLVEKIQEKPMAMRLGRK